MGTASKRKEIRKNETYGLGQRRDLIRQQFWGPTIFCVTFATSGVQKHFFLRMNASLNDRVSFSLHYRLIYSSTLQQSAAVLGTAPAVTINISTSFGTNRKGEILLKFL